jgi:hypothetical protein
MLPRLSCWAPGNIVTLAVKKLLKFHMKIDKEVLANACES